VIAGQASRSALPLGLPRMTREKWEETAT